MHHPQVEIMIRLIATARTSVTRFLDLGCGDGILGAALLQRYPLAHGVFADASDDMLQIARAKLQPYDAHPAFLALDFGNDTWQAAVAPYGPFDVVVSGYAIHHLPDREKRHVYRAIHGLLRPGGRFINIEYVAAPTAAGEDLFMAYLSDHAYAAKPQYGSMMTQAQVTGAIEDLMHTPDDRPALVEEQCAWLRARGFADVDCYFKLFGFAVFGGRRAGGGAAR
jgi:SAM-dependent methyltransferase